jgi:hypothetical protein
MMKPASTSPGDVGRLERWSDWLNPLLVREVRQSLRGRIFSGAIVLTSLISAIVLICGILAITAGRSRSDGNGLEIFSVLYYLLWGLCCVLLPMSAATRFRAERGSGEFELFLITGISARQVVSGKLQAALVQVLLALSVAAPFLMICYLLRGISAPQIALNLLALTVFTVVLTQGGILIGVVTTSKIIFGLLMIPFFWLLIMSFTMVGGLLNSELLERMFGSLNMGLAIVGGLGVLLYYFLLFHLGAVAMLEFQVRNRTFPLRLFLLGTAILLPGLLVFVPDVSEPQAFFYGLFLPVAVIVTLLVPIPDRPVPLPIREQWSHGWRRWFRMLFYPDRGSVLMWYALFAGILCAWETVIQDQVDDGYVLSVLCAALLLWSLLGNLMGRLVVPRAPTFMLSILGNGLPSLIAMFLFFADEPEAAKALCPITTPAYVSDVEMGSSALPVMIGLWLILVVRGFWLHVRCRREEAKISPAKA